MTRECLESLAVHTPPGLIEVCVVDNGSSDATSSELEPLGHTLFGNCFLYHRFEDNRGFAIASNEGARQARGDFVLFLNNDTLALSGWLPPLLDGLVQSGPGEQVGATGPLLLYEGGERVQHCGVAFTYGGVQHLYAHFPGDHPAVLKPRRFQALTAAALLMPRSLFLDLGLFHEGYRNGFEDLDLCRTLTKAGYSLRSVPESRMIHRESRTPGRQEHDPANAALYARRWPEPLRRDLYEMAWEDAFDVCLNDSLETCICLPPRKEAELNRQAAALSDSAAVWDVLRAYPVWRGGYDRMAVCLEREQRPQDVLYVRVLQSQFFPGSETAQALGLAAAALGQSQLAEQAEHERLRQERKAADMASLRRKAAVLGRQARRDGALQVEALYLDWLRRHGG